MTDESVFAKCAWRLIPFMGLLYVVNFIDRVNVGFAALTMNRDLMFSPTVFGLAAGIFNLGYGLFHVPATVLLERWGARRTVFLILLAWGAISSATAFVQGPASFYAIRFLLGVAEAGFFPGMIFYMTLWFPKAHRARLIAAFYCAIPLSIVIGGPLSGVILGMDGIAGLKGWQWLFLIEGAPACILAFVALCILPDGPREASWLSADEVSLIEARLKDENASTHRGLWPALGDARVLALGLVYLAWEFGFFGIVVWLPQIVRAMGFSNLETGFVVAVPYAASVAASLLWGRSSDARGERVRHTALAALVSAGGFLGAALTQSYLVQLVGLTFAAAGMVSFMPVFFSLPSTFLSGPAAAGGIALVGAVGRVGAFLGPIVVGAILERTGGYAAAMVVLALGQLAAGAIVLSLGRRLVQRTAP